MPNVFISHSKRDSELVRVIDNNFNSSGVTPMFMEFTPESTPPNQKIADGVSAANVVFLFLTQNTIASAFTQNWIAFEVGLAKKSKKPLYVIEDVHNTVHFPVPYFSWDTFNPFFLVGHI